MLKITAQELQRYESLYSGIRETIMHFEANELPICPRCDSDDSSLVEAGIIGRTIHIAAATTKFHLVPNYEFDLHGPYYCNACKMYFGSK